VTAVNDIEKRIPFSHDDRLGFLTFCPTNLGTTVRASVHIKVPKLAADRAKLEEVAGKYNLQVSVCCGQDYFETGGHVSACRHAGGCRGITTVFCGTLAFHE
jgi:creatine kinase